MVTNTELREKLTQLQTAKTNAFKIGEAERLLLELQVHQVELEMQNQDLRETQQALEDSRDRYADLYDFAPVGYLSLTGQGIIKELNLTAASLLGKPRLDLLEYPFARFVAKAERHHFFHHLRHCQAEGWARTELTLLGKDSASRQVQLYSTQIQDHLHGPLYRTVITDITDLKQAEEALRQSQVELEQRVQARTAELRQEIEQRRQIEHTLESLYEEQHTLVDALPDFIVFKDQEGRWRSANHNARRLFQLEDIDWVGKTDPELAAARPQCRALLTAFARPRGRAWQSRKIQILHQRVSDPEGNRRFLENRLIPLFDAEGRCQSILLVARDITALEQAEEDKKAAEKTHAILRRRAHDAETALVNLSEFTLRQIGQELHDDLGQVLTGAALLANSLARKLEPKRPQEAATARQLTHLLNEAVDKTRLISHGLAPIALDEGGLLPMLHSLARHLQATQGIAVSVSADGLLLSLGPEAALHVFRIAQEAASNVVRHSGATALWITLEGRNHTLTLSVLDNGIGIPDDLSQGSYPGIGISNMRARADLIGAQLDIKKRAQGGTAVVLSMPVPIGGTEHGPIEP